MNKSEKLNIQGRPDVPPRLFDLLPRYVEKYGYKDNLFAGKVNGQWVKYNGAKFCEMTDSISYGLLKLGVKRGDRIALVATNAPEWNMIDFAIQQVGAICVPIYPTVSHADYEHIFKHSEASIVFVTNSNLYNKVSDIIASTPSIKDVYLIRASEGLKSLQELIDLGNENKDDAALEAAKAEVKNEDLATIIYTSGTTGKRKGVMLSSSNLIANITYTEFEHERNEVLLSVLPMHHIFCFTSDYFKSLLEGFTVCLNGELSNIGKNLAIFQPTTMRLVPMICETLIRKVNILHKRFPQLTPREAAEKVFGKNINWIACGGAYVAPSLIDEYGKYGILLRQGYGMSECSPRITTSDFSDVCKYSTGKVLSVNEVRVQDGEIQVKGPSVMLGYYKRPEATKAAFTEDGYLHTGDLGYLKDNHVYLVGRKKNLIILSNGENVSPEEIENLFADESIVKEVVVYGENDKIVCEAFPDREFCDEMAEEEIEKKIHEIVDEINLNSPQTRQIATLKIRNTPFPRTSSGKIKRTAFYF